MNKAGGTRTCHGSLLQQLAMELAKINDLNPPQWDADTTDIVSIAALQPPPKKRKKITAPVMVRD